MPRPNTQALLAVALLAAGCPTRVDEQPGRAGTTEASAEDFRARAHEKALQIALPLAEAALILEDPLSAAQLDLSELRPEPIEPGTLASLRDAHAKAWREVEQIDADRLEARSATALAVLQFGLARVARRLERQSPARVDLGWAVAAAERFMDEAEYRLIHDDEGCTAGLGALADTLATAGRELGGSSPASLNAAREDLRSIHARLLRFPELASSPDRALRQAARAAAAAVDALVDLTEARIANLGKANVGTWGQPILPARDRATLVKLPARIGAAELRKRLAIEEAVTATAEQLFRRTAAALTGLDALARRASASEPLPPGQAAIVDGLRCEAVAKRVSTWAERTPDVTVSVRCGAIVRALGPTALDDAGLLIHIVGSEVVEPVRRARRKQAQRPASLLAGNIVPASHRHAATLGVLAGMGETDALRRAVGQARGDLCLAAAALWFHAELGDDDELRQRLAPHCDSREIGAWTGLAAAHPRRALRGLGLGSFGREGSRRDLDTLWWGPLGLPRLIAEAGRKPPPPDGANVKIEQLKPAHDDE